MSGSYAESLSAHRRLAVLIHLQACSGHCSNGEILYEVANGVGIVTSREAMAADLSWLRDKDLVSIEDHSGFLVVTITAQGLDVALGRARQDGVRRPVPKAG